MAQSKNTPSASAPLFIARSQSRALERAARSSAADHKRAAAATFFAFHRASSAASPKAQGRFLPASRKRMAREHFAQRAHAKPISAYAEVSPSFARTRTHSATFRCVNGVVKPHGFACEVRVTSADTSSGAGLSARVSERDFLQLGIEMYRVFAHKARPKASRPNRSWRCHAMSPWRALETAIRMPCAARNR